MANANGARAGTLDPDVRRFVEVIADAYRQHPAPRNMTERRALANVVRAPWAAGGPLMARTDEHRVACAAGDVRVRVFDPGDANGALVYLHGGGWTLFSIDSHDRLMREYAARAGLVVVGVDYALSPELKFPVALEQTLAVIRWLAARGSTLGVDADRLAVGGDSAGGNLALAAALALRDAGETRVLKAVIVNYGAVDDEISPLSRALYGGPGNMLEADEMDEFWRNYLRDGDRTNPLARPVTADLRGLPAVFVAIAECDVLAEQNERLARKLAAADVSVESHVYAGAAHSFVEAVSISALAGRAIDDGARWLTNTLNERAAGVGEQGRLAHLRE
jgi:acetyl esterase